MSIRVTVDNFVRAESDRMLAENQRHSGGINVLGHLREPTPIDRQSVIRMNRDTLYSFAVVDLAHGVELTLPDADGRYLSAMLVNNDHFVPLVLHEAGHYRLTRTESGTRYALIAIRVLVDPGSSEDVGRVQELQDSIVLKGDADGPFTMPDYDPASFDSTREAILTLAAGLQSFDGAFGAPGRVDPIRHLLGTAAGWGGLPSDEAVYRAIAPEDPERDGELTLRDVPVDAFWSVSVYNDRGFFEPNPHGRYSVNSVTSVPDPSGAVTVRFVHGEPEGLHDIPVPERWSTVLRLYRPRKAVLDGTWPLPRITLPSTHGRAAA